MKKKLFALVFSFVLVLSLLLTACGGSADPAAPSRAELGVDAELPLTEDASLNRGEDLEAYIEKNKSIIDTMASSMMKDGMGVEIAAKENSLICGFSFDFKAEEVELESLKALLNAALDSAEPTFNSILNFLKREAPSTQSIVVNYLDRNREVIFTREYHSAIQSGENDLPEGIYDSLENYVFAHRDELDQKLSGMAPDGMSLNISAEGSTMIYNVSFIDSLEDLGLTRETLKDVLDEQTDLQEAAFIGVLNTLKEELPFVECIRLNYLENDGSVITSRSFV